MAQSVRDGPNVCPFGNHQRGVTVTERMEGYFRKVMPFQKARKPGGESVGIDGLSVPLCEQPPGLYLLVAYLLFLLLLPMLIVRQ